VPIAGMGNVSACVTSWSSNPLVVRPVQCLHNWVCVVDHPVPSTASRDLAKKVGIKVVASATYGLHSPRDIAFTPTPGVHLGSFSSGRNFAVAGDEAWVANGAGHSITIVTGVGGLEQHSITRYDRGWYHYMINITALSFNMVKDSGRHPSRDTFAFFATCQDNSNTYASLKEPNFFQGPTCTLQRHITRTL